MVTKIRFFILIGFFVILIQNALAWELPNNPPDFVAESLRNTPRDTLVAIGFSEVSNNDALGIAIGHVLQKRFMMIHDIMNYAFSHVDPVAVLVFMENLMQATHRLPLNGLTVYNQHIITDYFTDGTHRTEVFAMAIVVINRNNFLDDLSRAAAATKLTVPAMASFDFDGNMNAAFNRLVVHNI